MAATAVAELPGRRRPPGLLRAAAGVLCVVLSLPNFRLPHSRSLSLSVAARRTKRNKAIVNQSPSLKLSSESESKRTATRRQLDYAGTLSQCSLANRRMRISGGLLACSQSNPRSHRRGQEFGASPIQPSPSSRGSPFREQQHRNAAATQLRNGYAIDLTSHARTNLMLGPELRPFQVRVIHEDVCRADEMRLHTLLC